jgi:hypothetical protein
MGKAKNWPGGLGKRISTIGDPDDAREDMLYRARMRHLPGGYTDSDRSWFRKHREDMIYRARIWKLPLLYDHFKIDQADPQAPEKLALALAIEYVEGFKLQKPSKRGPKAAWNPFALIVDVQSYIARKDGKASVREAIKDLQETLPEIYGPCDIDSLRRQYYAACKALLRFRR